MSQGTVCRTCRMYVTQDYAYHDHCADKETEELRAAWAAALAQLAEKEGQVCKARDYLTTIKSSVENVAGAFIGYIDIDTMINNLYEFSPCRHEEEAKRQREDKDGAYTERNRVVALLSAIYPSHLCTHDPNDTAWEDDWRTIVCIHSPEGQLTWHLHYSHVPLFDHLEMEHTHWDGHTTEEKYRRIDELRRRVGGG